MKALATKCYRLVLGSFNAPRSHFSFTRFSFKLLVDGNWGEWSRWSTCTKTCKQGKQSRKRECDSPAAQYGGKKCEGGPTETQACNQKVPCPGLMKYPSIYFNCHFSNCNFINCYDHNLIQINSFNYRLPPFNFDNGQGNGQKVWLLLG